MSPQKTDRAQTLSRWSFWLTLFVTLAAVFAPSNLFYGFDLVDWAVRGLRIDYLLPKIYLTDLLIMGIVWSGFWLQSFKKISLGTIEKILLTLGAILLARQFFTEFPAAAVVQFLRLVLFAAAAFVVTKNWAQVRLSWVWLGLAVSNLLEGVLSFWQFFTQHSLGSYRSLFGEPNLSQSFGLAHGSFGSWGEKILPYGTTAHPNILAAWLVSSWLLLMVWTPKITLAKPIKMLLLLLSGVVAVWGVFATQSITALGLLLHGLVYLSITNEWFKIKPNQKLVRNSFIVLVLCVVLSPWLMSWTLPLFSKNFTEQPSVTRRVFLQTAAQTMLQQNLVWGVGLNQFTVHLESTSQSREPVRFDQPVHQVFWLWLTETGLLGLLSLSLGIWWSTRKNPQQLKIMVALIWLLFPSLVWDHYLFTQPTGLLIVWFWWVSLRAKN